MGERKLIQVFAALFSGPWESSPFFWPIEDRGPKTAMKKVAQVITSNITV
jgi:hypothetical protein